MNRSHKDPTAAELRGPRITDNPASADVNTIVDNRRRRVGDFLNDKIRAGSDLSIVSAYFTIYAYEALRDALEKAGRVRFLYGEPTATGTPDPGGDGNKLFRLNEDGGMELKQALAQKPLARSCASWIRQQVDVRTISHTNLLHGKLYHIAHDTESAALAGSSNFTRRGLGFGTTPNVELNLELRNEEDREALLDWFDELWNDQSLTKDAKSEVLAALHRLGQPYAPKFVYYKTLFHIFESWLARHGQREGLLHDVHLYDSEVWKALYQFQKDGATNAINRLMQYNGCIVADSVGLGKTWTALAVIRFFELRNERVLVLCPKRLEDNWTRYTSWAASRNNPFEKDRLNYSVRAHTDLSRYEGRAGSVDLKDFNWGGFDLIVIDESHNFRNEGRDRTDEAGEIVRRSRYNRLLEEVLKGGVRTKVLMLSATPVNTSLRDLRNQIYLMTEKREDAFKEALGIGDIRTMFGVAQREFQKWEISRRKLGKADKAALLEQLGADFLSLLDAVTIARSRDHIRRYYPGVAAEIGGFPDRARPENLYPPTDSKGELSYDDVHQRIGNFRLAVYMPSQYLKDTSSLEQEKAQLRFDQRDRERWLIGMMRINLLKRLESSVHSFTLTMWRIIEKMKDLDRRIEKWREVGGSDGIDIRLDDDEEDEEFAVGRGRRYRFEELDVDRWQRDLQDDRRVLEALHDRAVEVDVDRDAKLAELKRILRKKIDEAKIDKDGRANRKAIVFTTFADTARYIHDNLKVWVRGDLGVHIALVTGGNRNHSSTGHSGFVDILGLFAPKAQQAKGIDEEIDILIATDCLSEGQNLQDCDLVVNYDIHWNPVRLMQRFGRIDRIGSRNRQVAMTNFWPTKDLDRYLDLKNRVEARMALADATATGLDDPLNDNLPTTEESVEATELELAFRDQQLQRLQEEILDVEDVEDGLNLTDLTLDDFLADLLQYIQQNRAALEAAPLGIHAVVDCAVPAASTPKSPPEVVRPGAIFCLKRRGDQSARTPNLLWPYFLVYVRGDGTVRFSYKQAGQCLSLFRMLAAGHPEAAAVLEDTFDLKTSGGRKMAHYDKLLGAALRNISRTFSGAELAGLANGRGAVLTKKPEESVGTRDFDLVTWLVILEQSPSGLAADP